MEPSVLLTLRVLLALDESVSAEIVACLLGGNAATHVGPCTGSGAAVAELLRRIRSGTSKWSLDGAAVLQAAKNNGVDLLNPAEVKRLYNKLVKSVRPECRHEFRPPGTLPKVEVNGVTYDATVFDLWWWAGLDEHLIPQEVRGALKAVCGRHSLSDLIPTLYGHLCLLRSEPQQVLELAWECAWLDFTEDQRLALSKKRKLDGKILDKINKGISTEKLKEFLPGIAKRLPSGVDLPVVEALLFVAEKADQGQVCKFGLRVHYAVMDDLVGSAAAHTSWQPPGTVISPAACEVIVYNAWDPQAPHLPTQTEVVKAFRAALGRSPQPSERTLLKAALTKVEGRTGWKPTGKSQCVHAVRDALRAAGITHRGSEIAVGGYIGARRRFDELYEDETGLSFIVEVDGEHHTQEVPHWERPLVENQEADVEKAVCHLEQVASNGERQPLLVVDFQAVKTKPLHRAFEAVIPDMLELLHSDDVDMVVVGKAGCCVRALPETRWEHKVVGGIEIRWAHVAGRQRGLKLAA